MHYCEKDLGHLTDLRYLKYMKVAWSSKTINPEGLHAPSIVEHTNGKYPGSKRLGFEVRRCLFDATCDGWRTCPKWVA